MSQIDDLLDSTLDDLEDLPEFKAFPAGGHKVLVSMFTKEINTKPAVEVDLKAIETLELADPNDTPLKAGDSTNIALFFDNEFGRGKFKKIAAVFGEHFGTRNNREIVEKTKNIECVIVTGQRKDKNDPDRVYTDLKEIVIV